MRQTRLRNRSARMAALLRIYAKKRRLFLEANPWCLRCGGTADQIHHARGRIGDLLLAEEFWRSACADCHQWITSHPADAIAKGYSLPRVAITP